MSDRLFVLGGDTKAASFKVNLETGSIESLFGGEPREKRMSVAEAYSQVGWLRRCIDVRASALSDVPFTIRSLTGDSVLWDSTDDEPPDELAFMQGFSRLLYLIDASLALCGRAYALIEREQGRITDLMWLNPTKVFPVVTTEGITGYVRKMSNGTEERYAAEDVLAIFAPDPFVELGPGSSDGLALREHAEVLEGVGTFARQHLARGLTKATIIRVPQNTPKVERDRLESWWDKFFGGKRNAGRSKVVSSDVEPTVIGEGMKDMANVPLTQEQREGIATTLGVPHSIVMSNAATFATAQADQLNLYIFKVLPQCRLIARAVNKQLLAPLGYRLVFESDRLEVMQAYELQKAEGVFKLVGGPILTRDEGREMMGREPLPDNAFLNTQPQPPQTGAQGANEREDDSRGGKQGSRGTGNFRASGDDDEETAKHTHLRLRELANFKSKVQREGKDVEWTPEHLRPYEVETIRLRLKAGYKLDDAFRPPFLDF